MSRSPTNPPAFPQSDYSDEHWVTCQGLSMRDYFAAKAMQGLISDMESRRSLAEYAKSIGAKLADVVAGQAYDLADAMLAAREK